MRRFADWVIAEKVGGAIFVSDNNGFDWQFHQLVLSSLPWREPVRLQFDQFGLTLQRCRQGYAS